MSWKFKDKMVPMLVDTRVTSYTVTGTENFIQRIRVIYGISSTMPAPRTTANKSEKFNQTENRK